MIILKTIFVILFFGIPLYLYKKNSKIVNEGLELISKTEVIIETNFYKQFRHLFLRFSIAVGVFSVVLFPFVGFWIILFLMTLPVFLLCAGIEAIEPIFKSIVKNPKSTFVILKKPYLIYNCSFTVSYQDRTYSLVVSKVLYEKYKQGDMISGVFNYQRIEPNVLTLQELY